VNLATIHKSTVLRAAPQGYRRASFTCDRKVTIHWPTMQLTSCLVGYMLVTEPARQRRRDHGRDFWSIAERGVPDHLGHGSRMRRLGHDLGLPGVA